MAVWILSFRAQDLLQQSDPRTYLRIAAALAGIQVYLLAAGILWWLSVLCLHAEKGPPARRQGEGENGRQGDKEKIVSMLLSRDGVLDRAEETGALRGDGRAGG